MVAKKANKTDFENILQDFKKEKLSPLKSPKKVVQKKAVIAPTP